MTLEQLKERLKGYQDAAANHRKNAEANDWAAQAVSQLIAIEEKEETPATAASVPTTQVNSSPTPKKRGRPPKNPK